MNSPATRKPQATLQEMADGFMHTQVLYVIAKLGIADRLATAARRSDDLASDVGADAKALYRILRAAEFLGLVTESRPGLFALTGFGEGLKSDDPAGLAAQIVFDVELSWPLWGELLWSIMSGEQADRRVFGKGFFDHLHDHPALASLFNDGMKRFVSSLTPAIVAAYDFSRFQTVVDVGGGSGALMAAILHAFPDTRGVIFDLPPTIDEASKRIAGFGLADRCSCVGGDFFVSVPPGDAIVLSAILSDWDDEKSVRILTNCRKAINAEGRVLVIERVLIPEEPAPHTAFMDLQMHLIGGTGRTREEFAGLLEQSGFELLGVIATGMQRSILEAKPVRR